MTAVSSLEVISIFADLVTAGAVSFGVWIAHRQLGSWRPEAQAKRRAEVAEQLISSANDADAALRFIRSPWGNIAPDTDGDPKSYQWRERLERMDQRREDFDRLRHAQVRARAFLEDDEVNAAVEQLFKVRQETWAALSTLMTGTETDGDPELQKFYMGLRWQVWGGYSERDELGKCQVSAIKTIESRLYPVVRLEPSR